MKWNSGDSYSELYVGHSRLDAGKEYIKRLDKILAGAAFVINALLLLHCFKFNLKKLRTIKFSFFRQTSCTINISCLFIISVSHIHQRFYTKLWQKPKHKKFQSEFYP